MTPFLIQILGNVDRQRLALPPSMHYPPNEWRSVLASSRLSASGGDGHGTARGGMGLDGIVSFEHAVIGWGLEVDLRLSSVSGWEEVGGVGWSGCT